MSIAPGRHPQPPLNWNILTVSWTLFAELGSVQLDREYGRGITQIPTHITDFVRSLCARNERSSKSTIPRSILIGSAFDITKRYLQIVREQIIEPACCELRRDVKLPTSDKVPLSERKVEMFWGLHGRIFDMAIRRFVYETSTPEQLDHIVRDAVRVFLDGSKPLMREIVAKR